MSQSLKTASWWTCMEKFICSLGYSVNLYLQLAKSFAAADEQITFLICYWQFRSIPKSNKFFLSYSEYLRCAESLSLSNMVYARIEYSLNYLSKLELVDFTFSHVKLEKRLIDAVVEDISKSIRWFSKVEMTKKWLVGIKFKSLVTILSSDVS